MNSLASVTHHACVVPLATWAIHEQIMTGLPSYTVTLIALAIFSGLIFAEVFVYAFLLRDLTFALHHLLVLVLIGAVLNSWPGLLRWAPEFLVCEASTFGIIVSYFLKHLGHGSSVLSLVANAYFVVTFFLLRIVNLGSLTLALLTEPSLAPDRAAIGLAGQIMVAALWILQAYWLTAIIKRIMELFKAPSGDAGQKSA